MARYSFKLCKASGEPLGDIDSAVARALDFQLSSPAKADVTMMLDQDLTGLLVPGFSRLKVFRERSAAEIATGLTTSPLVFYGHLPVQNVDVDPAQNQVTASFLDPRWVLTRRYSLGTETFAATDQGAIAWGLVNAQNGRSGGDTWIRQGGTTTSILRDRTYDRQLVSQLLDDLTQLIDGCDLDCDPVDGYATGLGRVMGNLRAYAKQGSDRPNVHFQYGPDLATNTGNIRLTYAELTTVATVVGQPDPATGSATALSSTYGSPTTDGFGVLEAYSSDPDVSVQATLDAKARGVVLAAQGIRPILTIDAPSSEAPRALEDYQLGDTIRASLSKGAFRVVQKTVRVHGINIKLSAEGDEDVTLTTVAENG